MPTFGLSWTENIEKLTPHAQFIRSVDWAATALGPPETWPQQLHQMVDLILADFTPSAILWGPSLTMIYNEGFEEFAGEKHPKLMGSTPLVSYAEVWEAQFAPIVQLGREQGKATRHKDVPLFLKRHGYLEEVFVDYTFVPIVGPDKSVVGFYHTAVETTNKNLARRRTQTLIDIGNHAGVSRSMRQYWDAILKGFESNIWDIPYAIAYEFNNEQDSGSLYGSASASHPESCSRSNRSGSLPDSTSSGPRGCSLAGVIGTPISQVPMILNVSQDEDDFHQAVKRATSSGEPVRLDLEHGKTPDWLRLDFPSRAFQDRCRDAVIMPIRPTTRNDAEGMNAVGFVVIGLNPRREFDEDYQRYTRLWSQQLATAAASVVLLEQETARQRKLKAQLSINEARFSRFAEMSNVAIWIVNPAGALIYGNEAYYDQMSVTGGAQGHPAWMECVTEDTRPALADAWKVLCDDKVATNFEIRLNPTKSTKVSRWLLSSAFPELAEDGSLKAIWGCNTDISHQKLAEELKEQRLSDVLEAKRQSESFIDTGKQQQKSLVAKEVSRHQSINPTRFLS